MERCLLLCVRVACCLLYFVRWPSSLFVGCCSLCSVRWLLCGVCRVVFCCLLIVGACCMLLIAACCDRFVVWCVIPCAVACLMNVMRNCWLFDVGSVLLGVGVC